MNNLEELSQAVTLTYLEVSTNPNLIYSQILANLMSKSLWELNKKIIPEENSYSPRTIVAKIHQDIYNNTYELGEEDVIERWGFEDILTEEKRLGKQEVKSIINCIYNGNFLVQDKKIISLMDLGFTDGVFMGYRNQIYDLMVASGSMRSDKRPEGGCADLAVLSASLAIANGFEIAVLGSPFHYMTFATKDSRSFLLSNKDFFDFKKIRSQKTKFTRSSKYYTNNLVFDRLITKEGVYSSAESKSTIPREKLEEWEDKINNFFGFEIPQLKTEVNYSEGFEEISFNSQEGIYQQVFSKASSNSIFELAQYCYRSPEINSMPYIIAANRSHSFKPISIEDINRLKEERILSEGRIVMPEEIFRFTSKLIN
jgi:hypothetical protein